MTRYQIIFILILILLFPGCSTDRESDDELLPNQELEAIIEEASRLEGIRSLVISREGDLMCEKYFADYPADSLDHVRSVTKSLMGVLIGIAIDQNILPGVNEPIGSYLQGMPGYGHKHDDITIKHLLTMSSGIQWDESGGNGYNDWVLSEAHISYVLEREVVEVPGTVFNYNSAGSYLLSVILTEASGMSTRKFAEKYLFDPMEIEFGWQRLSNYYNGAAGMRIHPRDLVKLGQLVSGRGSYNGQSLVREEWIRTSTSAHIPTGMVPESYGFQWWIATGNAEKNAIAIGYGGQYLIVFPDYDIIIVATSEWKDIGSDQALSQSRALYQFLSEKVFPYLISR